MPLSAAFCSAFASVVPSYLLKPVSVDVSNWKPVLIDSGYYKESQIR